MEAAVSISRQDGTAEDWACASTTARSIESAPPWRTFRWYMEQHYSGTYWSATVGDLVIYES
ncbi:hypothetical protein ACIRPS_34705 [Streptomyces griseoviridis]